MYKLRTFYNKHCTKIVLGSEIIICLVTLLLSFVKKVNVYQDDALINSYNEFSLNHNNVFAFLPLATSLISIIFTLIIIYIRDKQLNPIKAKKLTRYSYFLSIIIFVIDVIIISFFSYFEVEQDALIYIYLRFYNLIISIVLHAVNIYNHYQWMSEFGLEKYYGQPNSIYK
jgi:heme/copper-type cytochrome/quinol oxidase subunit 2